MKRALIIILVAIFLKDCDCRNIYISVADGEDRNGCGTLQNQCRSIQYGLQKVAINNDILYIDGGQDKPLLYHVDYTINVSKSIHIKKYNKNKPIILGSNTENKNLFAFNISQSKLFTLESISFKSIKVLHAMSANIKVSKRVEILNCLIQNTPEHSYAAINLVSNSYLNLRIKDSKFVQIKKASLNVETSGMFTSISNTHFSGYMKFISSKIGTVRSTFIVQNNTILTEANLEIFGFFTTMYFKNLNVSYTSHVKEIIHIAGRCNSPVIFNECHFTGSAFKTLLKVSSHNTIIWESCCIINNNASTMVFVGSNTNLTFDSCSFINNTWNNNMFSGSGRKNSMVFKSCVTANNIYHCTMFVGCIYNYMRMDSSSFTNNFASKHFFFRSGIYFTYPFLRNRKCGDCLLHNANFTLASCCFTKNICKGNILAFGLNNTIKLKSCNFSENVGYFLFITIANNMMDIISNTVINNTLMGVIYHRHDNIMIMNLCRVSKNTCRYILGTGQRNNVTLMSLIVTNNTLLTHVATLHVNNTLHITTSHIDSNIINFDLLSAKENTSMRVSYTNITNNRIGAHLFLLNKRLLLEYDNISNNIIKHNLLHAVNGSVGIHMCCFSKNVAKMVVFLQYCKILVSSSKFTENNVTSDVFSILQSKTTIMSSMISHTESGENTQVIKFDEDTKGWISKENKTITLRKTIISWKSTKVTAAPIMRITTKQSKIDIDNVLVNVTSTIEKVPVFFISLDKNEYTGISKNIVNISIECPKTFYPTNNNATTGILEQFCTPCAIDTYNLIRGRYNIIWKAKTNTTIEWIRFAGTYKSTSVVSLNSGTSNNVFHKCVKCPVGGKCKNTIRSSGNFYGYQTTSKRIRLIPCPASYCCSKENKPCTSFNTCNYNRIGILCGTCARNYHENYFSTECSPIRQCAYQREFWIIFLSCAILMTFLLLFLTNVKNLFNKAAVLIKSITLQIFPCFNKTDFTVNSNAEECSSTDMCLSKTLSNNTENTNQLNEISKCVTDDSIAVRGYTFSGIIALLISFYQIKSILTIKSGHSTNTTNNFEVFLEKTFNFDATFKSVSSYCPVTNLNAVTKLFLKNIMFILVMYFVIIFLILLKASIQGLKLFAKLTMLKNTAQLPADKNDEQNTSKSISNPVSLVTFYQKLGLCYVRILLMAYKNMATFVIVLLHCVDINGQKHLYIMGNVMCYKWWQILPAVIALPWLIFFPIALSISFDLYRDRSISFTEFLFSLSFPLYIITLRKRRGNLSTKYISNRCCQELVDMLAEPYKEKKRKDDWFFLWESWRLYQRFILVIIATYVVEPIKRTSFLGLFLSLFVIVYFKVKPYKRNMVLLHWMNIISLVGFGFQTVFNMLKSVLYVYDINNSEIVKDVLEFYGVFEHLFTPLNVIFVYFILKPGFDFIKQIFA